MPKSNLHLNYVVSSDHLLYIRWDCLSPREKAFAIEKVSYQASMLFDQHSGNLEDADYFEYIISPLLASSTSGGHHEKWWRQVKNSEIYNREERVVSFSECLKLLRLKKVA